MPAGPAMLALRTGAPLFVVSLWYDEDYFARGRLEGPVPLPQDGPLDQRVRAVTQEVADRLARGIAEHPQDWHMLQRLWLSEAKAGAPAGEVATEVAGLAADATEVAVEAAEEATVPTVAPPARPEAAVGDPVARESG